MTKNKIVAKFLFSFIIFLSPLTLYSQGEIILNSKSEPLNYVLIGMRDDYGIQLSFNDYQLSQYLVSADGVFRNAEDALRHLLADLPFTLSRSGEVFIISSSAYQRNIVRYLVAGQIRDKASRESLPYSQILFGTKWMETDFLGQFSFQTLEQPPYYLKASYLGYYVLDTIVYSGSDHIVELEPLNVPIEEVTIYGQKYHNLFQNGRNIGEIKINHQIAQFLPGNGDNSIFNLLRLQTGIVAAGEMANDIIIWGSYEGQSRVLFDGFTIFSLKNFNDNISAVNPFLAKDIRVLKGGYGPQYGERIGGIVNITGVEGARESPEAKISLNNLTLNGYLSLPVTKRSSFVMAFRQTYYDLYESSNLSLFSGIGRFSTHTTREAVFDVYPDYLFRDLNLKLSGETEKGDNWHLSLFAGSDRYAYTAEEETEANYIYNSAEEKSIQKGASAFYSKRWGRGSITKATASYSGFNKANDNVIEVIRLVNNQQVNIDNLQKTDVQETDFRIDHYQPLSGNHSLDYGGGVIFNQVNFLEDTLGIRMIDDIKSLPILHGYITDLIHIGKKIIVKPGVRLNFPLNTYRLYLQPRISFTVNATDNFRINTSAGQYNQFIALGSVLDESGNYRYRWTICGEDKIPVLSSNHYVGGISYAIQDFEVSFETYLKTTDGLTRLVYSGSRRNVGEGKSRSKGFDIFLKKGLNRNTFWVSYSQSRTEEYFDYFVFDKYRRALHDQTHEIKVAGILNFNPFYFSGNWVYGSGFKIPNSFLNNIEQEKPYNRVDLSAVYSLAKKKYKFDAGISMLNVFNTENIKFSNFTGIPLTGWSQMSIQSNAIPRTLTLFVNFSI